MTREDRGGFRERRYLSLSDLFGQSSSFVIARLDRAIHLLDLPVKPEDDLKKECDRQSKSRIAYTAGSWLLRFVLQSDFFPSFEANFAPINWDFIDHVHCCVITLFYII